MYGIVIVSGFDVVYSLVVNYFGSDMLKYMVIGFGGIFGVVMVLIIVVLGVVLVVVV